ncbi:hypothetical protein C1645_814545 [Glomus cerebriforme]|uniref:HTH CENPB-type domain-containing protein n=1 Tax=Glomus cerebriforme TaxID=658196 RepID=A0A397TKN4_9GLOM|nr:hypothetical protein C1645_814545 [Glomus cerebriforme]
MNNKRKNFNNKILTNKRVMLNFGQKKRYKEKWLKVNDTGANRQKNRLSKFSQLEEDLAIWITHALAANRTITSEIILLKADDFAKLLNIENFYELDTQSGPSKEELEEKKKKLQELISNYDIKNVFDCDEMDDEKQDFEAEEQEFQELLNEYYNLQNWEKEINTKEFITIDKDINIREEELTDEDIVNIRIRRRMTKRNYATKNVYIRTFINNPPDNFIAEVKHIATLKNLKSKISYFYKEHKK